MGGEDLELGREEEGKEMGEEKSRTTLVLT